MPEPVDTRSEVRILRATGVLPMSLLRASPLLLLLLAGASAGDAPAVSQQIQLPPPPRSENTVHALALDPVTGDLTPEGQQAMAKMVQDGWRALSMTAVTVGSGPKVAVLFSRPLPPPPQAAPPTAAQLPARPASAPRPPQDEPTIAKALLASTTAA